MARKLAKSTLTRLAKKLQDERERLEGIIASFEEELETSRLATTGSEFSDPDNADGGTIAAEIKMDLSMQQNARDLLEKVKHAEDRMAKGVYGVCERTGEPIPLARLEALPHATTTVEGAS